MQIQTARSRTPVLIPYGSGPKAGTPVRTAISLLRRETPVVSRIEGLSRQDVIGAKDGLFRFDAETPRDVQKLWQLHVARDPEYDEPDDGVICKDEIDRKIYLHWRPDLKELLAARGIMLTLGQERWFAHCERIHTACRYSLLELARKMDMIQPGFHFAERVQKAWDQHVLRILKYERRANSMLARCHTDRCGITYHIGESADGLRAHEGWTTVPHHTPQSPDVLCFSGKQLESITNGAVPALYHEVVDSTGGMKERWAMVFFGKMLKDIGTY